MVIQRQESVFKERPLQLWRQECTKQDVSIRVEECPRCTRVGIVTPSEKVEESRGVRDEESFLRGSLDLLRLAGKMRMCFLHAQLGRAFQAAEGVSVELQGAFQVWACVWALGGEERQKITKSISLLVSFQIEMLFFQSSLERFNLGQSLRESSFIGVGPVIRHCAMFKFLILRCLPLLRK